jgi:heme-degrading monooxygenase HmoA
MHAQVTTVEASPARLDDAIRFFREQVLPQLRQMDGFEEFIALSDRQSGKLLGVVLWENEEHMHSIKEVLSRTRGGISHPPGGAVVGVENYVVSIFGV